MLSGFGFGSIYFSLSVVAKMVIRDSRGKVKANNSWKRSDYSASQLGGSHIRLGGQATNISGRGG